MMLTIREELYADVIEEAKPLLALHWAEIALNPDIPLDPDYDRYARLAEAGMLAVYTVRDAGRLVGYAAYIIGPHGHYRNNLWALSDLFWVDPAVRDGTVGNALFACIESSLRAKGVSIMHTTYKTAHPQAGILLERRGHATIEHGVSLRLD